MEKVRFRGIRSWFKVTGRGENMLSHLVPVQLGAPQVVLSLPVCVHITLGYTLREVMESVMWK
jgi:hypothetical protein